MSAEEEAKNNGGAMPPETEAERPEETGRPASSSSGMVPDETNPARESADPSASARMAREEMESKYRNDPRFAMLFDHERKKGKQALPERNGGVPENSYSLFRGDDMADIATVYGLPRKIPERAEYFDCLDDEPESTETEQHKLLCLMRHKG